MHSRAALCVFVIHSLHTAEPGAYCGALACHEVGPSAFSFLAWRDSLGTGEHFGVFFLRFSNLSLCLPLLSGSSGHDTSQAECQLSVAVAKKEVVSD